MNRNYKNIVRLIIPILLSNIVGFGINMIDPFIAGQASEIKLMAINIANQYFLLFSYFFIGISNAVVMLYSRYLGSKDYKKLSELKSTSSYIVLFCLLIWVMGSYIFSAHIAKLYTDGYLLQKEIAYMIQYLAMSGFFYGFTLLWSGWLRSTQNMKSVFLCACLGFVSKVIFVTLMRQYLDVVTLLGIGTIIARGIELCSLGFFILRDRQYHFPLNIAFSSIVKEIKQEGLPIVCSDTLLAISQNMVAILIGMMGTTLIALQSTLSLFSQVSSFLSVATTNALFIVMCKAYGERNDKDITNYIRVGIRSMVFIYVINLILLLGLYYYIMNYFVLAIETKELLPSFSIFTFILVFFNGMSYFVNKGVLRSIGESTYTFKMDIIVLWFVILPLCYFLGEVLRVPILLFYICIKSEDIIKTIWGYKKMKSSLLKLK